jgi:fructokinase
MHELILAGVDDQGMAHYVFPDDTAWDHLRLNDAARAMAGKIKAVCFGTLAQRSPTTRKSIGEFIDRMPEAALKVYDLNLRQHFYDRTIIEASLQTCNVLKLNDEELQVITGMFGIPNGEREAMSVLVKNFGLRLAVVTRGAKGGLMLSPTSSAEHPGFPVTVADTIGAGDAFTAATALGLLRNHDLDVIVAHASRLAAHVCTQKGAMPMVPKELRLD